MLSIKRIALFRALQLGDMLCAVPALRALRNAWPGAHITLIGLPWAHTFVHRYADLIDELMLFPGAVGFPEQEETDAGLPAFYALARSRRFDLAIQMHGSGGPANDIAAQLGARTLAGFLQPSEPMCTGYFMRWPTFLPEPARYTALMRCIGIPAKTAPLDFPLFDEDKRACLSLITRYAFQPQRLICMHPGAQLPSRRWPPERFAAVADALAKDGWQIAITGTANEHSIVQTMLGAMTMPAIDLAGKTAIGTLASLIAQAQLIICNDTSVSHLAAAKRTASVVIACGSDTRRWAPLDHHLHRVLANWPTCRPCTFAICPTDHGCALNVSVTEVVAVAHAQLRRLRHLQCQQRLQHHMPGPQSKNLHHVA